MRSLRIKKFVSFQLRDSLIPVRRHHSDHCAMCI